MTDVHTLRFQPVCLAAACMHSTDWQTRRTSAMHIADAHDSERQLPQSVHKIALIVAVGRSCCDKMSEPVRDGTSLLLPGSKWVLPARISKGDGTTTGFCASSSASTRHKEKDGHLYMLCIPQAGMGAWVFNDLAQQLAPHGIHVLPVELPGRNSRMKEPCATDLMQLASDMATGLEPTLQCIKSSGGRYAVLGHSMGAWIAYELLQEITRRRKAQPEPVIPLPVKLYVAANRAPQLAAAEHDVDPTRLSKLPTPEAFWQAFERRYGVNEHLVKPEVRRFMFPMLKADFALLETYQGPGEGDAPLPTPCTAFAASEDNRCTLEQVAAWRRVTSGPFDVVELEGATHNFMAKPPTAFFGRLLADAQGPPDEG